MLRTLPLIVLLAISCRAAETPARMDILWDTWGVPHLYAADGESLLYAFGWTQAQTHGDLILRLYGEARGRAAEYWGAEHLEWDRWVHRMGIPARAAEWVTQLKPEYRAMTQAFADGINAYASQHPDRLDPSVRAVLPVTAADVMSHYQRVIHFTFVTSRESLRPIAESWQPKGSNAWAISPKRTATGHAILLANPHLPWEGLYTWTEAHLNCPQLDLYGATLIGFPFLSIGFNPHLGWTHTVNTIDGADLYEITPAEGGYLWDGQVHPFTERRHTLKARAADGSTTSSELLVRETIHGPLVAEKNGRLLALRVAGLDAPHVLEQYWRMGTATNLAEFESAHAMLQMPMFTTMYADREGHTMHLFGGRVPVRNAGGWDAWRGVAPGTGHENLWTTTHPYADLPRVADPPTGWLQNANDPPWTTTIPAAIRPDDYPPYLAPRSVSPFLRLRAQRSAKLLMADDSMTFEEVVVAKHSTRVELADRILDDLAEAVATHPTPQATAAMGVLEKWDRCMDSESRGGLLFLRFVQRIGLDRFAVPSSPDQPLTTPDGLSDPAAAVTALVAAAAQVQKEQGSLDVPWGTVHRIRFDHLDLPSNGGPGALGIFRNVEHKPDPDGRSRVYGGDSFIAVVEFGDPQRIEALLPYGNATQPGSPHRGDQLRLFSQKKLRPVWRTREQVEQHLERTERLDARDAAGRGL